MSSLCLSLLLKEYYGGALVDPESQKRYETTKTGDP